MQKEKTNNKIITCILVIIIFILIAYATTFFYKKFMKVGDVKYNSTLKNQDEINLTENEKNDINEKLKNSIQNPLRIILNFQDLEIDYDTNILNEEKNRFEIVWENMLSSSEYHDKFVFNKDQNESDKEGTAYINEDLFKQYYEKILNYNYSSQNIISGNVYNGVTINNGNIYGSFIENFNNSEFVLKVDKLKYNKESGIYICDINFITSINNDGTINYNMINNVTKPYAKLRIKYKKNGEKYKLYSVMFKKN